MLCSQYQGCYLVLAVVFFVCLFVLSFLSPFVDRSHLGNGLSDKPWYSGNSDSLNLSLSSCEGLG